MSPSKVCLFCAAMLTCAWGCVPPPPGPHPATMILAEDPARNFAAASAHNDEALKRIQHGDLDGAEKELRAAIAADPMFGPAHNSLGIVHYRRKSYYLAAPEFQLAATVMPKSPGPRNNLGLVYEAAGKLDDAARSYQDALAVEPDNFEAVANLARVQVRLNRSDDRTRQLLQRIVMRDPRPEWVAWARQRLALMGATRPASAPAE